ncbi:11697_t:CDS:1, partial [Ambispora leptoticha]
DALVPSETACFDSSPGRRRGSAFDIVKSQNTKIKAISMSFW